MPIRETAPARRGGRVRAIVAGALLVGLGAPPTAAEEWRFLGARYQGMGGAGVAVVDDEHAAYWNPGALAFTPSYGVALPVGLQAAAEGDAIANADRVARFLDGVGSGAFAQLESDAAAGNTLTPAQLATAVELGALLAGLDQPGEGVAGGVDASLLLRWERVAVSGTGLAWFGADPVFDRVNLSLSNVGGGAAVDDLVDPGAAMDRYAPGLEPALVGQLEAIFTTAMSTSPNLQAEELVFQAEQAGVDVNDPTVVQGVLDLANATASTTAGSLDQNASGAFVRGLAVEEIGVAYGHPLPVWGGRIGLGANLKYLYGTTFNKFVRFDDIDSGKDLVDDLTDTDRRETTHTASLDLGLMVRPYEWLRFGLTARNVTSPEFDLAVDPTNPSGKSKLTVDSSVRFGAALWVLPTWVIAFDADLTENESELLDGFSSRLVSLGTELRIPIWKLGLALRAGAYLNTEADESNAIALTGGLGLRLFDVNLDVAVGASPRTERIEAVNDEELPVRVNASAMLSFRRTF